MDLNFFLMAPSKGRNHFAHRTNLKVMIKNVSVIKVRFKKITVKIIKLPVESTTKNEFAR